MATASHVPSHLPTHLTAHVPSHLPTHLTAHVPSHLPTHLTAHVPSHLASAAGLCSPGTARPGTTTGSLRETRGSRAGEQAGRDAQQQD
jgi:hypothetical protein